MSWYINLFIANDVASTQFVGAIWLCDDAYM